MPDLVTPAEVGGNFRIPESVGVGKKSDSEHETAFGPVNLLILGSKQRMNLFYSPDTRGDTLELDPQESRHMVRVLRMKAGERVQLVDGKGGWFEAEIEDDDPARCKLKILTRLSGPDPLPYVLHIAISPTKSADRFEWFLEKATEIGITEITPLICHRTEKTRLNTARLEKILIAAMKQSLRAFKPVLHAPVTLTEFIGANHRGTLGIAHCISPDRADAGEPGRNPEQVHITRLAFDRSYTLLVGPEGDFTVEEVRAALDAGYTPFHLGGARLRTETAGVYICAAISLQSGTL
ncbi:MAG TPA: 16S rRNA (uracil(1498)-N(3))-methyltransferase [Bacteroides sp.]|nr:16S rRNA (uracil(1498)-N(3))-methyltransferase [Bacteroides sp.]